MKYRFGCHALSGFLRPKLEKHRIVLISRVDQQVQLSAPINILYSYSADFIPESGGKLAISVFPAVTDYQHG